MVVSASGVYIELILQQQQKQRCWTYIHINKDEETKTMPE